MNMNMEKKIHLDENSDRISNLPEPIKVHILSYLQTSEAVRTSILSNNWRGLWMNLPNFDFSRFQIHRLCSMVLGDGLERESVNSSKERYYGFLDRAFGSVLRLEMLNLCLPQYDLGLKLRVDRWLDRVVGCGVKYLKLDMGRSEGPWYSLPKSVLGVKSIMKLVLIGCEVSSASLVDAQLPCVQKLSLLNVKLDEGVVESLPISFPNLEGFTFKNCHGLTRLVVVGGLTKLVEFNVKSHCDDELEAIVIDAPNLLTLTYEYESDYEEVYQQCEVEASGCKKLKCLKLVGTKFNDYDFSLLLEDLPVLEELLLYQCDNLSDFSYSSQHLVHLEFEHCRGLLAAELYTPNLKIFHYAEDDPISFTAKGKDSVFQLTKGSIYLKPDIKGDKWFVKFFNFLAKLGHCEQLSICVGFEEDLMFSEKVMNKFRPPLRDVKHLVVELRASFMKPTPLDFVKALLWLAPSPESITIYNEYIPICKVLKFTYKKQPKGRKKCGCWKSSIFCWRHSLDKVSLENQKGDEDDTELATFFSNGRIDGKKVCFVKSVVPNKTK